MNDLGKVAFEAFHSHTLGTNTGHAWDKQSEPMRNEWRAAAEAVFKEMRRRYRNEPRLRDNWIDEADRSGLFDKRERAQAARAVVEAAREWWAQGPPCETSCDNDLVDALEALERAEGKP